MNWPFTHALTILHCLWTAVTSHVPFVKSSLYQFTNVPTCSSPRVTASSRRASWETLKKPWWPLMSFLCNIHLQTYSNLLSCWAQRCTTFSPYHTVTRQTLAAHWIQRGDIRNSQGHDCISGRLLKNCTLFLCAIFTFTFQLSISQNKVLMLCKVSRVVPVAKVTSPNVLNDYPPGAYLISYERFERIVKRSSLAMTQSHIDPLKFVHQARKRGCHSNIAGFGC